MQLLLLVRVQLRLRLRLRLRLAGAVGDRRQRQRRACDGGGSVASVGGAAVEAGEQQERPQSVLTLRHQVLLLLLHLHLVLLQLHLVLLLKHTRASHHRSDRRDLRLLPFRDARHHQQSGRLRGAGGRQQPRQALREQHEHQHE